MSVVAQRWAGQLPDSDALWVRLDDDADAAKVEDAVVNTVQHLLQPNIDVVKDLQVSQPSPPHMRLCTYYRSARL